MSTSPRAVACALALCFGVACRSKPAPDAAPLAASVKPVDRLAPGEIAPGDNEIFGMPLPRGMSVQGKFRDFAVASGGLSAEAVANYVRDHVHAERVEIGAARTVFPSARIKSGSPDRIYRIEVSQDGLATRLFMRDVTPPPAEPREELSNDELWKRAGFTRDGKPLDPKTLK